MIYLDNAATSFPKPEAVYQALDRFARTDLANPGRAGHKEQISRDLIYVDVWDNIQRRIKIAPLLGKVDCPCCKHRRFEWLDGQQGSQTTSLCGRNAVQVAHRTAASLNFEELARHLGQLGDVNYNRFLLKFTADGHEFTVFPDGRAIIKGTSDVDKARTLYAKYIGH